MVLHLSLILFCTRYSIVPALRKFILPHLLMISCQVSMTLLWTTDDSGWLIFYYIYFSSISSFLYDNLAIKYPSTFRLVFPGSIKVFVLCIHFGKSGISSISVTLAPLSILNLITSFLSLIDICICCIHGSFSYLSDISPKNYYFSSSIT